MTIQSLLAAVPRRRFLVSVWPWRGFAYTFTTAAASGVLWLVLLCPVAPLLLAAEQTSRGNLAAAAASGIAGIVLLALIGPPVAVALGYLERRRLRIADDRPTHPGRRGTVYLDPATWRAFAYLLVLAVVAPLWLGALGLATLLVLAFMATPFAIGLSGSVTSGAFGPIVIGPAQIHTMGPALLVALAGVALLPVLAYLNAAFAGAHAAIARALLSSEPDPAAARLVEVARSRARLVDAFDAERHRIERDLHDGAQQRLVSLTMQLGLAKLDLPADSPASVAVHSAHEQAKALMVELRDLIHGLNPRTLAELGLAAALEELAATSPVPVVVRADAGRCPSSVESVAYFAVAEALTNVAKHSAATQASVTAARTGNTLTVEVSDDGRGGADPSRGSGLTGLADRVAVAGGRLLLSSPAAGPTVVRIELPCGS